jgi:hypothetical protein
VDCRSDTLDLPFLLSRTLLKRRGWEDASDPATKKTWLWLAETDGRIELPFATSGPKTLRLTARCKVSQRPALAVVVSLNGHVLAALAVTPERPSTRSKCRRPPRSSGGTSCRSRRGRVGSGRAVR